MLDPETAERWAVGICAFTGAWGVLTGFAIFILVRSLACPSGTSACGSENEAAITFVLSLTVAAVASFVVESLRESVRGAIEPHTMRSIARSVVTILTLLVFELFVLASHTAVDIFRSPAETLRLRDDLLGPQLSAGADLAGALRDLIVLASLWIVTGAIVGAFLGIFVVLSKRGGPAWRRSLRGAATGLGVAIVAAPLAVLAYVVVYRFVLGSSLALTSPEQWNAHYAAFLAAFPNQSLLGALAWLIRPFYLAGDFMLLGLSRLWLWSIFGKVVDVALIAGIVYAAVRFSSWWAVRIVLVGFFVGILAPLLFDLRDVGVLALLAALVWAVPSAVLGFAAPLLDRPAERATWWSGIAVLFGIVVAALTAVRWQQDGPEAAILFVIALVLFGVAALFLGNHDAENVWPAFALCLAAAATGLTFLIVTHAASFHTVLGEVRRINLLPASVAAEPDRLANDLHRLDLSELSLQERMVAIFQPRWKGRYETAFGSCAANPDLGCIDAMLATLGTQHAADAEGAAAHAALIADLTAERDALSQEAQRTAQEERYRAGIVPQQLEVSLAGSFAFWVTVGLLSAWAIRRREISKKGGLPNGELQAETPS